MSSIRKLNLTPALPEATLLRVVLLLRVVKNGPLLITSGCTANGVIPIRAAEGK